MVDYPSASYDDAFDPKYGEPFKVPLRMANEETLKGYGKIVYDFHKENVEITQWPSAGRRKVHPGTGIQAGVKEGKFSCRWDGDLCKAYNEAVGTDFVCGRLAEGVSADDRTYFLTRELNYHPCGGQVFFSNGKPFVALLALPGDDIKLEDVVAFYFDGSFGVQIHANIWHQAPYPIGDKVDFLNKQCAVYACVPMDTVKEFGKYLIVPLKPDN